MMEDWICRQNIERWRSQLATARDERQREVLVSLLAEEHEKLRRALLRATDDGGASPAARS
jgi:dsDNA-binding SOS-regulon protein